jgi:hypothetical protein
VHGVTGDLQAAITAAGQTGTDAVAAHEAAADPHPTYLTQAEGDGLYLSLSGGTVTGTVGVATATEAGHALNQTAADARYAQFGDLVDFTSDITFSGTITVPEPTAPTHAASKQYVDNKHVVGPVDSAPDAGGQPDGTFYYGY